ncbi:MAG: GtrA family protein [Erysipelotrichaceae bacterium]|nr:GtrA family protein [Erysipelotrichaceae bacterium]
MKTYRDIFDPCFDWPIIKIFKPLYFKFKNELLYLFWGFVNTVISYVFFFLFQYVFKFDPLIVTVLVWLVGVFSGYFLYAIFVFEEHNTSVKEELIKFASGRVFSLVVAETITLVMVKLLGISALITKITSDVVTVILNYLISKFIVFK